MRSVLQASGIAERRLSCKDALLCGFYYAKCHHLGQGFAMCGEEFNQLLARASATFDIEKQQEEPDAYKKSIRAAIQKENDKAGNYFDLGFGCYAVTLSFGTHEKPSSLEAAQSFLDNDPMLRRPAGWFLGSLLDVGYSQDQARKVFDDDIVPWLIEERLRRWISNKDMPPMGVLTEIATKADNELAADSPKSRLRAAGKSLVGKVPVVGEPLSILLFGQKK